MAISEKIFSVSEFLEVVNNVLSLDFEMVSVQGEVSGFKISQGKWVWFALKDNESTMDCFMTLWQMKNILIEDGMEIKATGFPAVFSRSGRFTFKPQYIEPVGEGALKKQFDLLFKKLQTEGLFASERKRPLPKFPQHIGLITSKEAAAYSDFLKVLRARWGGIRVDFYHAAVQGADVVRDVVGAFEYFNAAVSRGNTSESFPSVLILTRGGGSLEDLFPFNSEEIARAIFSSKIPVIAAIGHERDTTIAELVADLRASTPSNAAELLVPDRLDIERELSHFREKLTSVFKSRLNQYEFSIQSFLHELSRVFSEKIEHYKYLEREFSAYLLAITQKISYSGESVKSFERLLKSLSPTEVLKRGFTITRDENGKILYSVKQLRFGDVIETQFNDGKQRAKIL